MGKTTNFFTKLLTIATLVGLGLAHSAKADSVTINTQVYFAGPTGEIDNPFNVTNPIAGANPIAGFALTSAGGAGTLTLNTNGNPGLSLVSNTAGLYNVTLYGAAANTMVTGSTLNAGTYTFSDVNNYFGTGTHDGSTGYQADGITACITHEVCNTGTSPGDVATITVGPNGLITLQSSSMELVASDVNDPPPSAPEIDPTSALSPLALLAGAVLIIRGRRKIVAL